ncbi:hypothetical protein CEK00_09390 [Stenotrophomonas maltophilia]|uniref:Uncharacterized protein n=1 Tax=Stenotrophomonas maltophilia TaxID=40324 RepID=A0A270MXU3_STEMA|nr:hypothetical protein [Stenotrophomonas maltophilia]PAM64641.1 hypothetical protein CEK00_21710 [Stenotrophomonas maltophilia]PAM71798.1 hypothetical protein CEK00_09390 [Stenotrophomonas maltophilia]
MYLNPAGNFSPSLRTSVDQTDYHAKRCDIAPGLLSGENTPCPTAFSEPTPARPRSYSSFSKALQPNAATQPRLAYDAPNFETIMSVRGPTPLCGHLLMRDSANPAFVNAISMNAPSSAPQTGDKLHININPEELPRAFLSISDILFAENSPFHEWKIADPLISGATGRIGAGAQITLYADTTAPICSKRIAAIRAFTAAIQENLEADRIRPGKMPRSDTPYTSFVSYRNDARSSRHGDGETNATEPFFVALKHPLQYK